MKKLLAAAALAVACLLPTATAAAQPAPHLVGAFPNQEDTQNTGGYLLYSNGNVVALGGAPYYGGGLSAHINNFVGMVSDNSNAGYWLVTSTGRIISVGPVCGGVGYHLQGPHPHIRTTGPVVGAVNTTNYQGFDIVTDNGTTFEQDGVSSY